MFFRVLLLATMVAMLSSCSNATDDIGDKVQSLFKQVTGQPEVVEVEDRTNSSNEDVSSSSDANSSTEESIVIADSSSYNSEGSSASESKNSESGSSSSSSESSQTTSPSSQTSSSSSEAEASKVVIIERSPLEELSESGISFTLYFSYDGYDIDDETTKQIIAHANFMRDNAGFRLRLEGHADERGTREYNLALGENRALSVKDVLGLYELASRIDVVSYGEEKPISASHNENSWKQNRRVEFIYESN